MMLSLIKINNCSPVLGQEDSLSANTMTIDLVLNVPKCAVIVKARFIGSPDTMEIVLVVNQTVRWRTGL
jgi:hypothetical protein